MPRSSYTERPKFTKEFFCFGRIDLIKGKVARSLPTGIGAWVSSSGFLNQRYEISPIIDDISSPAMSASFHTEEFFTLSRIPRGDLFHGHQSFPGSSFVAFGALL